MKIGIDCHNLEGQRTGVGRYLANLLREWQSKTDINLFLYFKNEIPGDVNREYILKRRWNFRLLKGKSNAHFKHWLLPRAARRDKVDVLFCPDYILPAYVGFRKSHMKMAVTIHDIFYETHPDEYNWPSIADRVLLKWASKQSAKKADAIFAPSEFTKNEILKYYKVNSEKVIVTPLAADPQFTKIDMPGERPAEELSLGVLNDWERIRRKYHIQDTYILFVGSIFNRRFLPQAIKGFAQFSKNSSDFSPYGGSRVARQFLIIGKNHTKPYQNIGAFAARANKELGREAVIWKNYASDEELVYFYNGAFATLWLSSYEGFGLPVLESMACGTPVITTKAGSLSEVGGDAAIYVEHPENPSEIAGALTRLVLDDSFYNELVDRGLSQVQNFSWQKTAEQTIDRLLQAW